MGTEGKAGEKILVVDDEPEVRRVLSEFLESRGYQPFTASSGVEALPSPSIWTTLISPS